MDLPNSPPLEVSVPPPISLSILSHFCLFILSDVCFPHCYRCVWSNMLPLFHMILISTHVLYICPHLSCRTLCCRSFPRHVYSFTTAAPVLYIYYTALVIEMYNTPFLDSLSTRPDHRRLITFSSNTTTTSALMSYGISFSLYAGCR